MRGRITEHHKHKHPDVTDVKPGVLDQGPGEVRAARISAVYRDHLNPVKVHDYVGPAQSLREHILRLSLFPNIYNRSTVVSSD